MAVGSLLAQEQRRQDLELMKILAPTQVPARGRINAVDATWEAWQKRTGELPPDFSKLRSIPFAPDPLEGVRTRAEWATRRIELKRQVEHWITGRLPPAPGNLRAVVTGEHRDGGARVRDVLLEFGPEHRGRLHVQVIIPPGPGPFPVFLTNHNRARPWVATAVARGYIGCIYQATDPNYGEEDDSDKFIELYPDYDFACLARWAWAASRAVDYLVTLPEVDAAKIGITGHSRNGKQAVMAAAFDERIAAVIASGGNTGEANLWRYTSDPFANETMGRIIEVNPHWFSPRLRFFVGRENKLPVDQNTLFALIAPRAALLASAYTESANSALGFEQNFRATSKVYEFLGAPQKLGLHLRQGLHATSAGDVERYVDFLDSVFGRSQAPVPQDYVLGYTFEDWLKTSGEKKTAALPQDKVRWALGEEPPLLSLRPPTNPAAALAGDGGWIRLVSPLPADRSMKVVPVSLGTDLKADLYLPVAGGRRLPLVIWLHPYAHANGYVWKAKAPFVELIRRGYAVLSFDQIGFGTRIEHARDFYRRYPRWSLLGKMVADTRSAITAATAREEIDPAKIYLLGYALGGKVALWTAALDPRPAGIVSIAGITPLRTSSQDTEGLRAYSHLHGLLPRLGFYADAAATLPLDYDDVFRAIGPRRTLLVAPTHDWRTDLGALRQLVRPFAQVDLQTPEDFNRFTPAIERQVFDWLDANAGRTAP
jgi:dienelactone hydrolase